MPSTTQHQIAGRDASISSTTARQAAALVEGGRVELVEDATTYRVQGRRGTYKVTLTATEQSCDCKWTHTRGPRGAEEREGQQVLCSHIGAALEIDERRKATVASAAAN